MLGFPGNPSGVFDSFSYPSSSLKSSSDFVGLRQGVRQVSRPECRSFLNAGQGGHRGGGWESRYGVLQPSVRGLQGFGGVETGTGCIEVEQICCPDEVFDGVSQHCPSSHSEGRLDGVHRSSGRIFSDPGTSRIEAVPEVLFSGQSVPVSVPLLWPVDSTPGIYSGLRLGGSEASVAGYPLSPVSRRLAVSGAVGRGGSSLSPCCVPVVCGVGLRHQSEEVAVDSFPGDDISGHEDRYFEFLGFSDSETGEQLSRSVRRISILRDVARQEVSDPPGPYGVTGQVGDGSPAPHEGVSVLAQEQLGHGLRPLGRLDPSCSTSSSGSDVVEVGTETSRRGLVGVSGSGLQALHRRVHSGVGSLSGPSSSIGSVVSLAAGSAHQPARVVSCIPCPSAVCGAGEGQGGNDSYGQFNGSVLPQEVGGDSVVFPLSVGEGHSRVGRESFGGSANLVCSRGSERGSRWVEQEGGDPSQRMDPSLASLSENLADLGSANGGSVRDEGQPQASGVHFPGYRSGGMGNRCILGSMGSSLRLCLSSHKDSFVGSQATRGECGGKGHSGGSLLAKAGVVSSLERSVFRHSSTSSSQRGSSASAAGQKVPLKSFHSCSSRLATLKRRFRAKGFSRRVSERLSSSVRQSTAHLYQSRWKCFRSWCLERKVSAACTPIPDVAEFLVFLRDNKKLSISSIRGYRSMIASVQPAVGSDPDLSILVKAFACDLPRPCVKLVSWSLEVVLAYLSSSLFEPLASCSLRLLTVKTLFLLSLATAKRVGELSALSKEIGFSRNSCVLSYIPSFIAKTESWDNPLPRSVKVIGLADLVGQELERVLCPVRALKFYANRVKSIRGPSNKLFCSVRCPTRPLSKNAISFFLRQVILDAHAWVPENRYAELKVKAHDIRSVATSVAFKKNVPIRNILEAATWRSQSVFSNFYLKECEFSFNDRFRLGPIVVASATISTESS